LLFWDSRNSRKLHSQYIALLFFFSVSKLNESSGGPTPSSSHCGWKHSTQFYPHHFQLPIQHPIIHIQ
jgi:hypothetical protein